MIAENEVRIQPDTTASSQERQGARQIPSWLVDLGCLAALALAALFFFRTVLFGQGYIFPWDFIEFMYPAQRFVSDAIHGGELPLWNPLVLGGYSIIADPQAGVLYPPYLLYHLLPWQPLLDMRALMWLEVIQIAVAGMGTYGLGRVMGIGRMGSLLAGLVFMLGGFFPVHVEHVTWVSSAAWLPYVLLCTALTLDRRRPIYAVGLAAALALSLLGGYTQQALLAAYTALALTLWWLWRTYREGRYQGAWRAAGLVVVGLTLGGLLTMAQTLPTLDTVRETIRSEAGRDWGQYGALSRAALVSLVLPTAFGSAGGVPYVGGEVTHSQKYLGLVALALVVVAFVIPLRNTYANFWRGLTVVAVLGSFGPNLYVYRLILLLPLMNLFRRPSTLYPIALLGVAVLAGMVIDRLQAPDASSRRAAWLAVALSGVLALAYAVGAARPGFWPRVLGWLPAQIELRAILDPQYAPTLQAVSLTMLPYAVALFLLGVGLLVVRRGRGVLALGVVILALLDLYAFNANQIFDSAQVDPASQYQMPFLDTVGAGGLGSWRAEMPDIAGNVNSANVVGVESLSGYNPLLLQRLLDYVAILPSVNSRLFDALNVRYLILTDAFQTPATPPRTFADVVAWWSAGTIAIPPQPLDPAQWSRVATTPDSRYALWENRAALPRFWGVDAYRVLPDAAARLAALRVPDFEPTRVALLETEPGGALTGRLAEPVSVDSYRNNGFQVRAEAVGSDALMLISVPYHPGWRAFVDNQPATVYPADHVFMAVRVPQGVHTVRLDFAPTAWMVGLWVTLLALAGCVVLLALDAWRARRAHYASSVSARA